MTKAQKPLPPEGADLSSWRGYTRYQCSACSFDTLDPEKFADHYRNLHGSWESHADAAPAFVEAPSPVGEHVVQE